MIYFLLELLTLLAATVNVGKAGQDKLVQDVLSERCNQKRYPMVIGGNSTDTTTCFVHDELNGQFIIGGTSKSSDFVPSQTDHAFLQAIDVNGGGIKWGNFYYNNSYSLQEITSCSMIASDQYSSSLAVLGRSRNIPVYIEIDTISGQVNRFIQIKQKDLDLDETRPYVQQTGSVLFDNKLNQIYVALNFDTESTKNSIHLLKLKKQSPFSDLDLDWAYNYQDSISQTSTSLEQLDLMTPIVAFDTQDPLSIYLMGQSDKLGSIIKIYTRNGSIRYQITFDKLSQIVCTSQVPTQASLYGCGTGITDNSSGSTSQAVTIQHSQIFKMTDDGQLTWVLNLVDSRIGQQSAGDIICKAVNYDLQRDELSMIASSNSDLLGARSYSLSSQLSTKLYDSVLFIMTSSGLLKKVLNFAPSQSQLHLGIQLQPVQHALVSIQSRGQYNQQQYSSGEYYFVTQMIPEESDDLQERENPDLDIYLFKYQSDINQHQSKCYSMQEIPLYDVQSQVLTRYSSNSVSDFYTVNYQSKSNVIRKELSNYWDVEELSSITIRGYNLYNNTKIPSPCAYGDVILEPIEYYRGQQNFNYNINQLNRDEIDQSLLRVLDQDTFLALANGTVLSEEIEDSFSFYDDYTESIRVQTDEIALVGTHKTVLYACYKQDELVQFHLDITVRQNSPPRFVTAPKNTYSAEFNKTSRFELPMVIDPDGNDVSQILLGKVATQEDNYPQFLTLDQMRRELVFTPTNSTNLGQRYYFNLITKESNSELSNEYPCVVNVSGPTSPQDTLLIKTVTEQIPISLNILQLNSDGLGVFEFTEPINMTYLSDNFESLFEVYFQYADYNTNQANHTVKDFSVSNFDTSDNQTVSFKVTFDKPQKLGLLVSKSDKLCISVRDEQTTDFAMLLPSNQTDSEGNVREYVLSPRFVSYRIELQFDYDNEQMELSRKVRQAFYWITLVLLAGSLALLLIKRFSLFSWWTLLEYMQLIGFLPMYNFRLIAYLYEAFQPFLVSHMIFFEGGPMLQSRKEDYLDINHKHYQLSITRLGQSFMFSWIVLLTIITTHLVLWLLQKYYFSKRQNDPKSKRIGAILKQLNRHDIYWRYLMFFYFDLTFASMMKITEGDTSTSMRLTALVGSYLFFIFAILLPLLMILYIHKRHETLAISESNPSQEPNPLAISPDSKLYFGVLLDHVDRGSKMRLLTPVLFFSRRLFSAMFLALPFDNRFNFFQYVIIFSSSVVQIVYLSSIRPYKLKSVNNFVYAFEVLYLFMIVCLFMFSDATPIYIVKFMCAVFLLISLFLLFGIFAIKVAYMIKYSESYSKGLEPRRGHSDVVKKYVTQETEIPFKKTTDQKMDTIDTQRELADLVTITARSSLKKANSDEPLL